jgi:hypothetical protein
MDTNFSCTSSRSAVSSDQAADIGGQRQLAMGDPGLVIDALKLVRRACWRDR